MIRSELRVWSLIKNNKEQIEDSTQSVGKKTECKGQRSPSGGVYRSVLNDLNNEGLGKQIISPTETSRQQGVCIHVHRWCSLITGIHGPLVQNNTQDMFTLFTHVHPEFEAVEHSLGDKLVRR